MAILKFPGKIKITDLLEGTNSSVLKGDGSDFIGLRKYEFGDSYQNIDWKATARLGEHILDSPFFVKEHRTEKNIRIFFCLDITHSMSFGSKITKRKLAKIFAKDLMNLMKDENNKFGLIAFTSDIEFYLKTESKLAHCATILEKIGSIETKNSSQNIISSLKSLGERKLKSSLLLIISDFQNQEEYETIGKILKNLKRKHELIAIKVCDKSEYVLPEMGKVCFYDFEANQEVLIDISDDDLLLKYKEKMDNKANQLKKTFSENNIQFIELFTDSNPKQEIIGFCRKKYSG